MMSTYLDLLSEANQMVEECQENFNRRNAKLVGQLLSVDGNIAIRKLQIEADVIALEKQELGDIIVNFHDRISTYVSKHNSQKAA